MDFIKTTWKNYKMHVLILVHGINKSSKVLTGLEKFVGKQGFEVLNIDYPSTKFPIEHLIDIVHLHIHQKLQQEYSNVSFVGFSMGGLIIRAYLHKYKISNLGKVVLVGTPNQGSEVADFLKNNKLYQKLYGPAGQQLITEQEEFSEIFGSVYYECGIIAGSLPLDPCFVFMRGKPNDGKVTVESTKIENMRDHVIVKVPHWYQSRSKKIWFNILHFLKHSSFQKNGE